MKFFFKYYYNLYILKIIILKKFNIIKKFLYKL